MKAFSKFWPIKNLGIFALVLVLGLISANPAQPNDYTIEFIIATVGSISYCYSQYPSYLTVHIPVTQVITELAPHNQGVNLDIIDGFLDFTFRGSSFLPPGWIDSNYHWYFERSNFEITGTTSPLHGSGILAWGQFYTGDVERSGNNFHLHGNEWGSQFIHINPDLLSFYGNQYHNSSPGGLEIDFLGDGIPPGPGHPQGCFTSTEILGGGLSVSVPLPSTLLLLGTGLGLLLSSRRKLTSNN